MTLTSAIQRVLVGTAMSMALFAIASPVRGEAATNEPLGAASRVGRYLSQVSAMQRTKARAAAAGGPAWPAHGRGSPP